MARRRLSLPGPDAAPAPSPAAPAGAPEVKAWGIVPPGRPPIAQVAGDAAAASALHEMSRAFEAARLEGRLVQRLPLAAIAADHLLRDRIAADEEATEALVASLREHGQRVPVEVEDLGGGRYGLISGWRRLAALARLAGEEARFGTVLAFVRSPAGAAEAYVAMVEENEIRLGLSYYERARIVARAADLGVFASEREALARLFASGSRARRSKIGSFVTVVRALDGHLRFPAALPERLGLRLAQAIAAGAGPGLASALDAAAPGDAAAEQALLARALAPRAAGGDSAADPPAPPPSPPAPQELRPGVFLTVGGGFLHPVLTLSGPAVGPEFRERLVAWIETGR